MFYSDISLNANYFYDLQKEESLTPIIKTQTLSIFSHFDTNTLHPSTDVRFNLKYLHSLTNEKKKKKQSIHAEVF